MMGWSARAWLDLGMYVSEGEREIGVNLSRKIIDCFFFIHFILLVILNLANVNILTIFLFILIIFSILSNILKFLCKITFPILVYAKKFLLGLGVSCAVHSIQAMGKIGRKARTGRNSRGLNAVTVPVSWVPWHGKICTSCLISMYRK